MKEIERIIRIHNPQVHNISDLTKAVEQYIHTEKAKMLEEIVKLSCKKDVCIEDLARIGRKHCK